MRLQYKTTTKYLFFSLPFYLMLFACGLQITDVEYALREAGENRGELEAVLSHYAKLDDRQKLEAAQYLIRYMPYHTSYDKGIEDYYHAIDSVVALSEDKLEQEKHIESLRLRFESKYKQKRDIEVITSEFLIQSIDEAFKQWRECEWAEHLDFEQFCEYLLPYKCFEGQPLTEWRNAYYDICKGDIDLAYLCDEYKRNPIFAATEVNNQMKNTPQSFGLLKTLPIYDPDIILKLPFSNCATYCLGAVLIMRSKGIPVAYDFTPNWSTGNNGHSWNTVYTTRFGNLEFAPHTTDPGTVHYPYLKVPKIFRNVYKPNEEYLKIATEKYIPPKLRNMFIRDVTAEYMPTIDIRIPLQESLKSGQSPFIAIYDGNNWTPVYWGKIAGSHVVFERMGLNTCYIALAYDSNGNAIPISKPFLASASKHIQFIEPDTSAFRTIRLNRKYPLGDNVFSIRKKITGGIIETSENREFDHTKKIAELPQGNLTNGTVFLDKNAEYRYWRFTSSNGTNEPLGNMDSQERIGRTLPGEFPDGVYKAFPFDSVISWNIRNFGPLYVPKAGDKVEMNRENYLLYRKLIAWEQKAEINYNDSTVFLNGEPIREYRFLKNYYFMAGDKGLNSQDSRYWGLLPEEYIVGKAAFVWKSVDPYTGKLRWDRFMKKIE